MGLFKGDANVNTGMAEAKRNVSAGIKQLKIAKWKVELKEKKNENVKLKEEGVPGAIYLEKNQKNAQWNSFRDGFFVVQPKQPERKRNSYKGKYARTVKFLKLTVHTHTHTHTHKNNNLHVSS